MVILSFGAVLLVLCSKCLILASQKTSNQGTYSKCNFDQILKLSQDWTNLYLHRWILKGF